MGDPIKPLQALHEKMVQSDLLNEGNRDYNNFAAGLATTEARQRLYEVLKADGKVSVPFEQFESGYFSDYTPPEKKDGGYLGRLWGAIVGRRCSCPRCGHTF